MFEIKQRKPQVLVATPGRLMDLCEAYDLDLSECRYQIIDEADSLLEW